MTAHRRPSPDDTGEIHATYPPDPPTEPLSLVRSHLDDHAGRYDASVLSPEVRAEYGAGPPSSVGFPPGTYPVAGTVPETPRPPGPSPGPVQAVPSPGPAQAVPPPGSAQAVPPPGSAQAVPPGGPPAGASALGARPGPPAYDQGLPPEQQPAAGGAVRAPRPARGAVLALLAPAALAVVLLLLAVPVLTLVWRAAFGDVLAPAAVVGGVLLLAGLVLLGVSVLPLLPGRSNAPEPVGEATSAGLAAVLRPPVLTLVLAVLVLAAAALAVG